MHQYAAILFFLLTFGVVLFQIALICGAPWGEITLGGRWKGRLPPVVRLIPAFSILLLGFFCVVLLARAGLWLPSLQEKSKTLVWLVVAYCALGCVANAATPSKRERMIWLPVVGLMLVLSLVVALA